MSSNLIQNHINKPTQQTNKKPAPNFDIQKELNNRTFIKPLKGKGKLLSTNIFYAPIDSFKEFNYSLKAIKNAANGHANDHELGKINDIGLMAGGLAIASYLFTKKTTPLTKGMEFVGLGSFLASMALWPKIAIQLPAYLIHGVNVHKQYEDSFGRKKMFYQDPQFIPWDLYPDKEIQAIGDRLGVPKNIPNRRDFIQDKMRKIALQNNTLWMLTAGFATPIMSALICNQTEPFLAKYLNNLKNKKADKILTNLDNYALKKYGTNPIENKLKTIIGLHANKPVNNDLVGKITEAFTNELDPVTSKSFEADLKKLLTNEGYYINETTAKNINKNLNKQFEGKGFSEKFISTVLPTEEDLIQLLKNKNILRKNLKPIDFKEVNDIIIVEITKRVNAFNQANPDNSEDLNYIKKLILNNLEENHPIIKALKTERANIFDATIQVKLTNLAKIFDSFRAKNLALDEYALLKVGSAPETVIANYWNDVSNSLLKTFGITSKEIEKVRFDRNLMGELLRQKIEHIVSDQNSYNKVMTALVEKVISLDTQIKPSDIASKMLSDEPSTAYDKAVDRIFDEYATSIKNTGFGRTAKAIAGENIENGSAKHIQKAYVQDRLLGVKSAFNRLINTLDLYRRIATNPNSLVHVDNNLNIPREVKEELIELCKIVSLEGHSSDHATKFWMLRNPNPADDYSQLEVKDGKIINKYYGHTSGTDIPGDKYFYQNAMNFMFGENLHPDTANILEKNLSLKDELIKYRQLVMEKLGGDKYFAKPRHLIRAKNHTGSDIKFLLTGIATDELFHKAGQQAFNTNKWLKMFGGFGAGLLGVTILAQFFFGKMKTPRQVKND